MSLHRIDPRFVLPNRVDRAIVLGGLDEWRAGLSAVGVDVVADGGGHEPPDLVVSPVDLASQALIARAPAIIFEGSCEGRARRSGCSQRR